MTNLLVKRTMPLSITKRNMQLIRHLPDRADAPTALAIGNFDGLHLGHRAVIETMLADARTQRLIPSVLTFEPHPRRYFTPDAPAFRLETLSQKLHRLHAWGVERIYMPRFDAAFAARSAEDFLQNILQQSIGAKTVVTGENFAFGKARQGTTEMLQQWGAAHGVRIHNLPPVLAEGEVCSSTAVRQALARGDMQHAAALLGRPYSIRGWVRHGDKRGRQLGFPTANLRLGDALKLPKFGIYAVRATIEPGAEIYTGVASLGVRPTIAENEAPSLETYLFDFNRDIYGRRLNIEFVTWLRGEEKFDSLDALQMQIAADVEAAKAVFA